MSRPKIRIRHIEGEGWCAEIYISGVFTLMVCDQFLFSGHKTKSILVNEINTRYSYRVDIIHIPKQTLHRKLVDIAYKWVLKNGSCGVAIKEISSAAMESPDVIGFGSGTSLIVEVKTSRTDFLNDKRKRFRQHPSEGMGMYRYYCCPSGLIKVEELPEGWGLIYVNEKGRAKLEYKPLIQFTSSAGNTYTAMYRHDRNIRSETLVMYSVLRRMQISGNIDEMYERKE